jgi:hypothetical protein
MVTFTASPTQIGSLDCDIPRLNIVVSVPPIKGEAMTPGDSRARRIKASRNILVMRADFRVDGREFMLLLVKFASSASWLDDGRGWSDKISITLVESIFNK